MLAFAQAIVVARPIWNLVGHWLVHRKRFAMSLKFRLKGLAETFVEDLHCGCCGHDGGDGGDERFSTALTRVSLEGIIVVIQCEVCGHIFVPGNQRLGVIDFRKLHDAVERDSKETGEPIFPNLESVKLDVEKLNAIRTNALH